MSGSKKINAEQLIALLDREEDSVGGGDRGVDIAAKYVCWRALDPVDEDEFVLIARLECSDSIDREYSTECSYWSADYPFALRYYPNFGASVYVAFGRYYLVVREFGGHVPETRCRRLQRDRIIL